MQTEQEIRTLIIDYVTKWMAKLDLQSWTIDVHFTEAKHLATCDALPEYQRAELNFNLVRIRSYDDLEELVVHELVHCLIWPLANSAILPKSLDKAQVIDYLEEEATTKVAKALLRVDRASGAGGTQVRSRARNQSRNRTRQSNSRANR